MKNLLLIILLIPLFASCSRDDDNNGIGGTGGTSYLSEIIVKEHVYKFGQASILGEPYESYQYDRSGNLLKKETNYYYTNEIGRILSTYEYSYDDKGKLVEKRDYTYLSLDCKYIYSYNSIDSISEMKKYDKDGRLTETWTYEYDNSRKLIKAKVLKNTISANMVIFTTTHMMA